MENDKTSSFDKVIGMKHDISWYILNCKDIEKGSDAVLFLSTRLINEYCMNLIRIFNFKQI